jgi:4-hydroxybenzoate polyprenyltransferase
MPINAISVAVIAFIGSGLLTPLTIMVSAVFGFVSSTFFVTMMSMDYKVDRLNGKMTTIASYPAVRWCTIYPLLGIGPILLCLPFVAASIGAGPAILIALLSALILIILSLIGSEADKERLLSLSIGAKDIASSTGNLRLNQLYLSVAFAITLSLIMITWGF